MSEGITQSLYTHYVQIFINAAVQAGKEILTIYEECGTDMQIKGDGSPLTRAGLASHRMITKKLSEIFPNIPIMSEEGKSVPYEVRRHWKEYFCIDPLDGTKEFIKRNGEFTINRAFIYSKKPVVGVVYVPVQETMHIGCSVIGSF